MKYFPTRRTYRRIFRRVRFYLPFVALLLLAMVLFLPISGGWLAGWAQKEAAQKAGLLLDFGGLEVTLAEARVEAFDISVSDPDGESAPFVVGRAELDGRLNHLLAGGERWPDSVRIDGLPTLRLSRNLDGAYQLNGPYQTLGAILQKLQEDTVSGGKRTSQGTRSGVGRTPAISVYSLPIFIEPWRNDLPPLHITLDRINIAERPSSQAPVRLIIRGVATAETSEAFTLIGMYFPDQERLSLDGRLGGLSIPFSVPPLGRFQGAAKDLDLETEVTLSEEGLLTGSITAKAGQFAVARDVVGGERWNDESLEIRLRFRYELETGHVYVDELSLNGDQVDVALAGEADLSGDFPGEARLEVRRLPAAALSLVRGELVDRLGVTIDQAVSSPTLRLDVTASGPFANPAELTSEATLEAAGWELRSPRLLNPVRVDNLALRLTPRDLGVEAMQLRFGGLSLNAEGTLPLSVSQDPRMGHVSARMDGEAEAAFNMLLDLGYLPREIVSMSAPINLESSLDLEVSQTVRGGLEVKPQLETLQGSLTWKDGQVGLRMLASPVKLSSGEVRLRDGIVSVERLHAQVDELDVTASGDLMLNSEGTELEASSGNVDVSASGDVTRLYALLSRVATLPPMPPRLGGHFQLEASAQGSVRDLENVDYAARLVLDQGTVGIDIPYKQIPVSDIAAEIFLARDSLEVRRLSLSVEEEGIGPSTAEISASVTDREIRAEGKTRLELGLLPIVLRKDLRSVYMEGLVPGEAWATLTPSSPLPPGPDLIRRWIAYLQKPGLTLKPNPSADLIADFEIISRQEDPISVFPREFPVKADNIRGNARLIPGELILTDAKADMGSAKDVEVDEFHLYFGRPTRVTFVANIDHLDTNEWSSGWGKQEWASKTASITPRWKSTPEPYQFVSVDGKITADTLHFLKYDGEDASADFHFEAWSRRPGRLVLKNMRLNAYEGSGQGELEMTFPKGQMGVLSITASLDNINIDPFLDTHREMDQKLDGYLTSDLEFFGQLLNYPTYAGEAEFSVEDSSVVGSIILVYARDFLQSLSDTGGQDSDIEGSVWMADQEIHFPRLLVSHPNIKLASDGYLDFRGRLFFDVAANFIGRQFSDIPLLGTVGNVIDRLGNEMVIYRVRGKLGDPKTTAIPGVVSRLQQLRGMLEEEE